MNVASKSLSTMSDTQQALHIYLLLLLITVVLGYVFIIGKHRALWESSRGISNPWGLRVETAESRGSYGRFLEYRLAVLQPQVSYCDQKGMDGLAMQEEQHDPKPRALHKHSMSQSWSARLYSVRKEKGSNGPSQRKEIGADPEKSLMVTKILDNEIINQVLIVGSI